MDYIQKLSDDLLRWIFSYLVTSTIILPPYLGDPRLHLMAVSLRWRRVILKSSNLWDTVVVLPSSSEVVLGLIKIAEHWLRVNSRDDRILSVFLLQPKHLAHGSRPGPRDSAFNGGGFSVVEDGILPAARCTEWFSCTLGTEHGIKSFFAIPPGQFDCLERLELSFPILPDQDLARTTTMMINQELPRFMAFQSSPHLRSVLISIKNGIHPLALRIPWWQLTKIDMRDTPLHPSIFFKVLSASAPSLNDGSFTILFQKITCSTSAPQETLPIVNPRFIQYLRLQLIDPSLNIGVFSRMHLTALCHLRIDLDDQAGWIMSIYRDLVSESRDTLKSLVFSDAPSRPPLSNEAEGEHEFDGLFAMCPNLELMQLPIGLHIPRNTGDKIAEGILLPYLRILEVSSIVGVDILDMVERRNELAYHHQGWIGSSKLDSGIPMRTGIYPAFFSGLLLHMLFENRSKVKLAEKCFRSSSSSQGTVLDIRYGSWANLAV